MYSLFDTISRAQSLSPTRLSWEIFIIIAKRMINCKVRLSALYKVNFLNLQKTIIILGIFSHSQISIIDVNWYKLNSKLHALWRAKNVY